MPPCVRPHVVMELDRYQVPIPLSSGFITVILPHVRTSDPFLLVLARLHTLHVKTKSQWTKASFMKLCRFLKEHGEKKVIETYRRKLTWLQSNIITRMIRCAIAVHHRNKRTVSYWRLWSLSQEFVEPKYLRKFWADRTDRFLVETKT